MALEAFSAEDPQWREDISPMLARIFEQKLGRTLLYNTPRGALYASFVGESRPDDHLIRLSDDTSSGDEEILRKAFDLTRARSRSAVVVHPGQVQPRRCRHPRLQPPHGEQTPGADLS